MSQIDWAWQEAMSRAQLSQDDKDKAWMQMAVLKNDLLYLATTAPFKNTMELISTEAQLQQ